MKKTEKSYFGLYFIIIVLLLYLIIYFIKPNSIIPALNFFVNISKNIIPVFIIVLLLMILINYLITPIGIKKYIGNKTGIKSWTLAIITGIISTGPIYVWYPMLRELKDKGVGNGFIATFLYNRAIKIPLLPMIILYFGLKYTIILTIVMIFFSVLQGIIIEKIGG